MGKSKTREIEEREEGEEIGEVGKAGATGATGTAGATANARKWRKERKWRNERKPGKQVSWEKAVIGIGEVGKFLVDSPYSVLLEACRAEKILALGKAQCENDQFEIERCRRGRKSQKTVVFGEVANPLAFGLADAVVSLSWHCRKDEDCGLCFQLTASRQ